MKILITGGNGFIGTNLCLHLLSLSHQIISIDNFFSSSHLNLTKINHPNFSFYPGDIIDFDYHSLPFIPDQIYHLACPASPKAYQKDPIYTNKISYIGTLRLLEYCQFVKKEHNKDIRLLFTSTSEVYGDPLEHPQKETYWGNRNCVGIRSCYDIGKAVGETLMMDFHRQYQIDIRICRIFNTFGPFLHHDDGRVISNFICQALQDENITIYGNGSQTRSCCYVDDLVNGLVCLMNQTNIIGPVNLGNPHETTIKELAEIILKLIPESKSTISYYPLPSDDPKVRCPDITLAKENIGWEPKVKLEDGLLKTIEYFIQVVNQMKASNS